MYKIYITNALYKTCCLRLAKRQWGISVQGVGEFFNIPGLF